MRGLTSNQSDSQADFIALRIIDNLIRFNQSFRLSQVAIKANMGKYKKKGSGEKLVEGVYGKDDEINDALQNIIDKVEINDALQNIIDNVETNDKAAKKEEASTKIKNAMLTKGWVTRKSPNI